MNNNSGIAGKFFMLNGSEAGAVIVGLDIFDVEIFLIPQASISYLKDLTFKNRYGVYFLIWDESYGEKEIYIGSSKNISNRALYHEQGECDELILLTSKSTTLNKEFVEYLESKYTEIIKEAGIYKVRGARTPSTVTHNLSIGDVSTMTRYMELSKIVLKLFRSDIIKNTDTKVSNTENMVFYHKIDGKTAEMHVDSKLGTVRT